MRLSPDTLDSLSDHVARPGYDRDAQLSGIVHLGVGAFHRAHQAVYTDAAMDGGDRNWGIVGVSLRSPGVAAQMNPQHGLYTVTERSAGGSQTRLIGAVKQVLVAQVDGAVVVGSLAAASTHIVSLTVTEKGYCRAPDGSLDPAQAAAGSIYPVLAAALTERRASGLPGLTLLTCDNLSQNGVQLQRLLSEYLDRQSPALRGWFDAECTCPSTMVDRIVPATSDSERATIEAAIGLADAAAVATEPFNQWVIEDRFAGPRPRWDRVGVQLTSNVQPYETAKLRMLNGAHSALAYLGLARGHRFVHQAIADPGLFALVDRLMRQEAAPTIATAPGQNLDAYADLLLARFANPALGHRLAQIAMDGSQKIPQRWIETLAWHQTRGRSCGAILAALAAWLTYVGGAQPLADDPLALSIRNALAKAGNARIDALLAPNGPLDWDWKPSVGERAFLEARTA